MSKVSSKEKKNQVVNYVLGHTGTVYLPVLSLKVTDLICQLPLATLFQHARSCSPWRPAAIWVQPGARFTLSSLDFQGPVRSHWTPPDLRRFPGCGSLSQGKPIPWHPVLHKEKRTLSGAPASFSGIACIAALGTSWRPSLLLPVRISEPDSFSIGRAITPPF